MARIQEITYPLNLGVANDLKVSITTYSDSEGGEIFYSLFDVTPSPRKRMSTGRISLTEAQVTAESFSKEWALNYVATELGVTLIT